MHHCCTRITPVTQHCRRTTTQIRTRCEHLYTTNTHTTIPLTHKTSKHLHCPTTNITTTMSPTTHASHHPRIAIVGAGLGGLTLARLLTVYSRNTIRPTIYEAEPSANSRDQGGTLDMHAVSGQAALKAAGLWQVIQPHLRPEGEDMTICGADNVALWQEVNGKFLVGGPPAPPPSAESPSTVEQPTDVQPDDDDDASRPEVDRGVLRKILLDSLPDGTVRWGSKVTSVTSTHPSDIHTVHTLSLSNREQIDADLIVGADGTWSKVRPLLSAAVPSYTGVTFVDCTLKQVDTLHPEQAKLVGSGLYMAAAAGQALIGQRQGSGNVRVYVAVQTPVEWAKTGLDWTDAAAIRNHLLQRFQDWTPEQQALISQCEDSPIPVARPIYALPADHTWTRTAATRGITLIGDAGHVMAPSGEGANLAMQDGAELARAIVDHPGDMDAALQQYEAALFPRSHGAAKESVELLAAQFSQQAPQSFVDLMTSYFTGHAAAAAPLGQ